MKLETESASRSSQNQLKAEAQLSSQHTSLSTGTMLLGTMRLRGRAHWRGRDDAPLSVHAAAESTRIQCTKDTRMLIETEGRTKAALANRDGPATRVSWKHAGRIQTGRVDLQQHATRVLCKVIDTSWLGVIAYIALKHHRAQTKVCQLLATSDESNNMPYACCCHKGQTPHAASRA